MKLLSIVLALLASACATHGRDFSFDDAARVRVGMTGAQVLAILGPPSDKHIDMNSELWMWIYVNVSAFGSAPSKSFSVKMENDVVVFISGAAGSSGATQAQGRTLGVFCEQRLPSGDMLPRITRITPGSIATVADWRVGDLIVAVDEEKVRTLSDVIIATQRGSKTKSYTLQRGDNTFTSVVTFP